MASFFAVATDSAGTLTSRKVFGRDLRRLQLESARDIAISVNRVPIRLTDERWSHIVNAHDDLAGYYDDCLQTIEYPDLVLAGRRGSLKAVKAYGKNRYLVVIYRELARNDGFVVTAYFLRRIKRRKTKWRR